MTASPIPSESAADPPLRALEDVSPSLAGEPLLRAFRRFGHWSYWLTVCLVVGAAALARLSLPAVPFLDGDVRGYLSPALEFSTRGEFVHQGREFVYPGLVHLLLRVFGGYPAVLFLQHLLGIAAGLLLLRAWHWVPMPPRTGILTQAIHRVLGLVLLSSFLLSAWVMEMEHGIRPESIYPFGLALLLYASLRTLAIESADPRCRAKLLVFGTLVLLDVSLLAMLRPQARLIIPVGVLLVVVAGLRARLRPRWIAAVLATGGVLSVLLFWIPEQRFSDRDPSAMGERFLPGALFAWHMHLITDVLEAELRDPLLEERDATFRRKLLEAFDVERARFAAEGRRGYAPLGFNPESLYHRQVKWLLKDHFVADIEGYRAFCFGYFWRGVREQPLTYARKVLRELGRYYRWQPRVFSNVYEIDVEGRLGDSTRMNDRLRASYPQHPAIEEMDAGLATADTKPVPALPFGGLRPRYRSWYQRIERLNLPLLLLVMPLAGALSIRRRDGAIGRIATAAIFCSAFVFSTLITAAAAQTLLMPRYTYSLTMLSLIGQCLMLFLVVVVAESVHSRHRRARDLRGAAGPEG